MADFDRGWDRRSDVGSCDVGSCERGTDAEETLLDAQGIEGSERFEPFLDNSKGKSYLPGNAEPEEVREGGSRRAGDTEVLKKAVLSVRAVNEDIKRGLLGERLEGRLLTSLRPAYESGDFERFFTVLNEEAEAVSGESLDSSFKASLKMAFLSENGGDFVSFLTGFDESTDLAITFIDGTERGGAKDVYLSVRRKSVDRG